MINNEQDICQLVAQDEWMMEILRAAKALQLPDWWVCAGFVRSKLWDTLHGYSHRTPLADVDVIYFDPSNPFEQEEKRLEKELKTLLPNVPWSVKNQARMHVLNQLPPFTCSVDAISKFPETATALGLQLNEVNQPVLAAPHGIEDVLKLYLRPTPLYIQTTTYAPIYAKRVKEKNWAAIWPQLTLLYN